MTPLSCATTAGRGIATVAATVAGEANVWVSTAGAGIATELRTGARVRSTSVRSDTSAPGTVAALVTVVVVTAAVPATVGVGIETGA